jgi:hypothetical protein
MEELEIIHFGHPSDDRPTLLNFRDRTPKRTDRWAIENLIFIFLFMINIDIIKLKSLFVCLNALISETTGPI